jgi:hypothetical protein
VRDYTLASHSPTELQQRQRQFVQQLVQECTDDSSKDSPTARSYVRGCLKFHVRGAVKIPLCEDADVLSGLMHSDDDISSQALQGCGASKVNDLALWLRDKEFFFMAGKLWKMLGYGDQSASKTITAQYFRNAWHVLAKVPAGTQPEALSLEAVVRQRVFATSDNQQEKAECLEWLVDLNSDEARMNQLNARGKSLVWASVGVALISFSSSHFCSRTAAPIEQLQRGAWLYLQYALTGYGDWAERTGFLQWYSYGQLSTPLTGISICYIAPDVTNDREIVSNVLGKEGEKLHAWHSSYTCSFAEFHLRVSINCLINSI